MKRSERNRLAAYVFSHVFDRESNLAAQDRLDTAIGAAIDVGLARNPAIAARIELRKPPTVVNEIDEQLLWKDATPGVVAVAVAHGLTLGDLLGPSTDPGISAARDEAFYALYRGANALSVKRIARLFNCHRDKVSAGIDRHAAVLIARASENERKAASG